MSHIEIDGGIVTSATLTNATGTHALVEHVGAWRFFVCIIDDDGSRETVWESASYADAILFAEGLPDDCGPVRDNVVPVKDGGAP